MYLILYPDMTKLNRGSIVALGPNFGPTKLNSSSFRDGSDVLPRRPAKIRKWGLI
jgi:hypothetical protein